MRPAMLLHLGEGRTVQTDLIEALLDFYLFVRSRANGDFLQLARSEGRLETPPRKPAATVVVTSERVFLSPLTRQTLARRVRDTRFAELRKPS